MNLSIRERALIINALVIFKSQIKDTQIKSELDRLTSRLETYEGQSKFYEI